MVGFWVSEAHATTSQAASSAETPSPTTDTKLKTPAQILYEIFDPTKMTDVEQAAVFTLMTYLKKIEVGK